MTNVYEIIDKIKELLRAHPIVNHVTFGDIMSVDLDKTTIFPLSHFTINNATMGRGTIVFSINFLFLDIVNHSKEFNSNDKGNREDDSNLIDIFNTQLQVANYVATEFKRGDLYSDAFQLVNDPVCNMFKDRFENELAGWTMQVDIEVKNTISAC